MSRPYQFSDKEDRVTSPLDRRAAAPYAQGQAPSFKTNVNRAKTKKWVEAKAPSYGGDDWDDYDDEDEYGVEAARASPLPPLPGQHAGRSFTQPVPAAVRHDRRNSFDAGDERRAFSSGFPQIPPDPPQAPGQVHVPLHVETSIAAGKVPATDSPSQYGSAIRLPSASSDLSSTNPEHRRDFSPSALPTPLRAAPTGQFPPQQASSDVAQHVLAVEPPPPASPPSSIIRPADIYKRHLEEEQRRPLYSHRQSIDSDPSQEVASPVQGRAPSEIVAERKSEYGLPGFSSVTAPATTSTGTRSSFAGLAMPTGIGGDTGFGDEFWGSTMSGSSGMTATAPASSLSPTSASELHDPALQHQPSLGFTSLVHQAFDTPQGVSKQDSLRSQDATDSSVSRSNTTGTSDISPIMSRVPSSATVGSKLAERSQATPAIEEEAEGTSRRTSQATQEGSVPAGFTPGFRRDLNTPSPNNSPARSPAVETNTQLPIHGVAAKIGPNNPAAREADIVEAIASSPDKDASFLASIEKSAQGAFIDSHKSDIPIASSKITRAESPSKGRVADLAGRFDASPARRGSVESWEGESVGSKRSRSTSPVKDEAPITLKPVAFERPQAERETSFRPKLPGAFESYISTRSTSPVKASDATRQDPTSSPVPPSKDESGDSSDIDFTPTSAKHTVKGKDLAGSNAGPLAALAAAGAAIGEAFRNSVGSGDEPAGSAPPGDRLRGDVYSRPGPPERIDTNTSSLPPTPLPKDDDFQPLLPSKERDMAAEAPEVVSPLLSRPIFGSQPSMDSGPGDFESDRLRREIVRSLSPEGDARLSALAQDSAIMRGANRTSNAIPSEYDNYWAAGDDEKEAVTAELISKEVPSPVLLPLSPQELRSKSTSPNYLDKRFSWEKREDKAAATVAVAAAVVLGGGAAIAAHHELSGSSAAHPAPIRSTAIEGDKRSSTLQPEVDPLSLNPKLSGEGLHIVNVEPGELPTPADATPITPNKFSNIAPELYVPPDHEPGVHSGLSPIAGDPVSPISPIPGSHAGPRPPSGPRPKTGEEARPASFREILAIKSTPTRIAKYEETRRQFANTNTGLSNWLGRTLEAHPEHREVAAAALRPAMNPIAPPAPRHKTNASISRVFTSKESSPASSTYVDPGAEYKSGPVSAGPGDQRASTGKSKDLGKDILKTAGVLGGKGMKEAKGLFSKGKSRFRGSGTDKDEEGSSRPQTPSSISISSQDSRPPSSKRTSRSFSPFHRFSGPASVILPDHAEPMPVRSIFDNQRPRSVTSIPGQYWPEPASVPMLSLNPTPKTLLRRSLTPQSSSTRLGILPSPSRSAHASDSPPNGLDVLPNDHLESMVRHSTPPFSPAFDADQNPTQGHGLPLADTNTLAPRASNRLTHQRIVSMLQPEEIFLDNSMDDPVSPISPVDDAIPEGFAHDVKLGRDSLSSSTPAISVNVGSPLSPEHNNRYLHLTTSGDSHGDISRDHSVKVVSPGNAVPRLSHGLGSSTSTDSWGGVGMAEENGATATVSNEPPFMPREPKGKGKVNDLAKLHPPAVSLQSDGNTRDACASSTILEHAQTVQTQSKASLESTRYVGLKPTDRLKEGADRLAEIAEAHRKMRAQFEEEDAARETPHDFLVAESAAKRFDRASLLHQSLQVPGQQRGAVHGNGEGRPRGTSTTSTKTMPNGVWPSMIITEPMSDNSHRTKSLGAATGGDKVSPPSSTLPLPEVLPRSMPSVSSMGQEDARSSADHSPTGQDPPVSPVRPPAFETRVYNPPKPALERPMSFVPLARDSSGLPVQELISTAKHPLDLNTQVAQSEEQQHTPPSGGIRRMSRQFDNTQSTSPSGLRRMSRKFEEQGDASPKGRRRSRQVSTTMRAIGNTTEPVPGQPSTSRPLSMAKTENRPGSWSLSTNVKDPYRPVQLYDRPSSGASTNFPPPTDFQTLVNSNLRHGMQDVRHQGTGLQEVPIKPASVDPIKKRGLLQKLRKKASPAPAAPQLTMQGLPPRRINGQEITSVEPPRLGSLQSLTSTVDSEEAQGKKDKQKRSSFLSGLKRPVSDEANRKISGESSPVQTHQLSPAQLQFTQAVIPSSPQDSQRTTGLKSKKDKLPHRALTHTGQEMPEKKRFSGLGNLFARSGTTGHAPNVSKKLSKEPPKGTIFHLVPDSPTSTAFQEQQRLQAAQWQNVTQGQHPQNRPLSPNQIVGHSGQPPPAVGYYAPASIPPPSDRNFGHSSGVAGYDAIVAHQNLPAVSSSTSPGEGLAGSTGSATRWLSFGRKESAGSGTLLSPQVSTDSPMDQYQRHNSGGSISPVSARRDSSPGQLQGQPPRGFRMGRINETPGQHQERPWALNIPNEQEDDGDREIMRQEIFHAASQRWQRGSDGQMHAVPTDQPLQSPLGSPGYPGSPPPTSASHPQPQPRQQYQTPANDAHSYLPPQASHSIPSQVPIYRPTGSPAQSSQTSREHQAVGVPGQYQPLGMPEEYRRDVYNLPTGPDEPQIPSLPQGRLQLMQPRPKRLSYNGSPVAPAAPMFEQALQDPRLDPSFRSRSNVSAIGASTMSADPTSQSTFITPSPPSRGVGSAPTPRGIPNLGITTSMSMSVHQLPRSHSLAQPPSQHILYQHQQQQPEPYSEESKSTEDLYSDPSKQIPFRDDPNAQPPPFHAEEETDDLSPPPPPKDNNAYIPLSQQKPEPIAHVAQAVSGQGLGGSRIAAALALAGVVSEPTTTTKTGRVVHERNASEGSDEMPIMKASGYPGDEWVPSWDGLD
ncbi:hypothetical protein EG328_007858 [Venturia inaequalis]|uniref:Uncharacterized protein n=1 Tax=Venturia inaequalis TaxID=5025 RepID=A0A8H3VCG6_VENIN|nr:hypothetical protein EG328_007858 [Venturia inaequalis]